MLTKEIKLIVTDVDGTLTNGNILIDQNLVQTRQFSTADKWGFFLCKKLGIPIAFISTDTSKIVTQFAVDMKVDYVYQGIKNKIGTTQEICNRLGITLENVAYVGDDLFDLPLLSAVGFSAVPSNSPDYLKYKANVVLNKRGGDGAFREFVEMVIGQKRLEEVISKLGNEY